MPLLAFFALKHTRSKPSQFPPVPMSLSPDVPQSLRPSVPTSLFPDPCSLSTVPCPFSIIAIMPLASAPAAGTFRIGGDLPVHRLGYGTMRLVGEGAWGEPRDPEEARRVLRRAVELDVNLIDTADAYGPEIAERLICEALAPLPAWPGHRHQGRNHPPGPCKDRIRRPRRLFNPMCRNEPAPPETRAHRTLPAPPYRPAHPARGIPRRP